MGSKDCWTIALRPIVKAHYYGPLNCKKLVKLRPDNLAYNRQHTRLINLDSYPLVHSYGASQYSIDTKGIGPIHFLKGPTPFVPMELHKCGPKDTAPPWTVCC